MEMITASMDAHQSFRGSSFRGCSGSFPTTTEASTEAMISSMGRVKASTQVLEALMEGVEASVEVHRFPRKTP